MTPTLVRVVLDTNVLVAGIRSSGGASREILLLVGDGVLTPLVSVPLFVEYESVLKREEFRHETELTEDEVDSILDYILAMARLQRIDFLWRPLLPDGKDDCVLECAVNGRAESLLTFNKRHFPGVHGALGIRAETPRELLMAGMDET